MKKLALGFTLIELLVVISLIGILATLVMANLNAGRGRARDAQRKSDLRQISTGLRLYYNDNGTYPPAGFFDALWGLEWTDGTTVYMSVLSKDPLPSQVYKYELVDSDNYILSACLENKSDDKGIVTADTTWCPSAWQYQLKP